MSIDNDDIIKLLERFTPKRLLFFLSCLPELKRDNFFDSAINSLVKDLGNMDLTEIFREKIIIVVKEGEFLDLVRILDGNYK